MPALGACQLAEGVLQRVGRQLRVETRERVAEAPRQHDLAVGGSLGRGHVGCDVGTVDDLPAGRVQPGEGGVFDDGLGEGGAHAFSQSSRTGTAKSPLPKLIVAVPS